MDHHGPRRAQPHGTDGPTLFLCEGETPGIELERVMNTMDRNYVEGHGVVRFTDLRLPASAVLGEVGQALRYAQLRLAPARLTHCMRWLGAASRAQSIAVRHARERTAFGKTLGEHQGVSFMIADNEIALQQCRLAIWWACWTLDMGDRGTGRHESSMVKAYVSEELFKVADRCVQILGGIGISDETPVGMIFSDMRAFRLYDGPTEVHKYAIARQVLRAVALVARHAQRGQRVVQRRVQRDDFVQAGQLHRSACRRIVGHDGDLNDLLTFSWVAAKIRRPTDAMKLTSESSMTRTGGSTSSAPAIAASKAGAVLKSISPPMLTTAAPSR